MASVRRIPGAGKEFVPGPSGGEEYYDMAPEALAQLPPELLMMLGLTTDPHNANPNAAPMRSEDDENGYWDAKNMGNGRGNSFVMENGKQLPADPVGNGAMIEELMQLIGPAGGGGQDIAAQVQQAVGVPIPPQVLQYMIEEGWTPEEMIEILAKEVQETGGIADNPIPQ